MDEKIRKNIGRRTDSFRTYLHILEARGQYKLRQNIKMSDRDLRDYCELMKAEVLLMTVDVTIFEAFLAHVDGGDQKTKRRHFRKLLADSWRDYRDGIRANLVEVRGRAVVEEKTDEEYERIGEEASEDPEGDAGRHVGGSKRAVPGSKVGERRKGGGPAS